MEVRGNEDSSLGWEQLCYMYDGSGIGETRVDIEAVMVVCRNWWRYVAMDTEAW